MYITTAIDETGNTREHQAERLPEALDHALDHVRAHHHQPRIFLIGRAGRRICVWKPNHRLQERLRRMLARAV